MKVHSKFKVTLLELLPSIQYMGEFKIGTRTPCNQLKNGDYMPLSLAGQAFFGTTWLRGSLESVTLEPKKTVRCSWPDSKPFTSAHGRGKCES